MDFRSKEGRRGKVGREAARKLKANLKKVDGRTAKASQKEGDESLDEALKNARPGYRGRE